MSPIISLVIADDHEVVRHGIRAVIERTADIRVVGEANNGVEAVALVSRLQPDILLVDLSMPRLGGIATIKEVVRVSPRTRCVVLSMYENSGYAAQALRSGARGYIVKQVGGSEIVHAIRRVAAGERYVSSSLSPAELESQLSRITSSGLDLYDTLSGREREILQLVAEGSTSHEIAERLAISVRTVETHRANLMRKLDLHTVADLVLFAVERGLVQRKQ
ncbi:MAG TPA: response regulator transcription factor [Thermoanaerobaculia bacterium]|nr:response regulator transcription factor [Thermoanaerobaculia bacterium]